MVLMMERRIQPSGQARFEDACQTVEGMDVPVGYRAEIFGGSIVMTPWSQGFYLDVMDSLEEQLRPHAPEGHRISQAPCLYVFPGVSRAFGPDIHVADARATRIRSSRLPGHALSLVAELTSDSTASIDRVDKVESYGMAGVPVYVLVDMLKCSVTVYSSPGKQGYRSLAESPFGDTAHIPTPFDCAVDTSDWDN